MPPCLCVAVYASRHSRMEGERRQWALEEHTISREEPAVGLSSVDRALRLLEALAANGNLRVTDLARHLDTTKATAFRLLRTLKSRGYVEQLPDSTYALGARSRILAAASSRQLDLRRKLQEPVYSLHSRSEETVQVCRLEPDARHVSYIDQVPSTKPVRSVIDLGDLSPAHCVSGGLALLAQLPSEQLDTVLSKPLERYTDATITDPDELRGVLHRFRTDGFAFNRDGYRDEVSGVSAPIRQHSGEVVAAIGVCLPTYRLERAGIPTVAEMVQAAATECARKLGYLTVSTVGDG